MRFVRLVPAAMLLVALAVAPASAAPNRSVARSGATAMPAPVPCSHSAGSCWEPGLNARWQYQLQGSPGPHHTCRYPKTGFVNVGVTGTSFASGKTVAPTVFDIDILQDGKCYSPQDYSVLNYAAVQAIHVRGAKVIGYIDAGTAETWRPDFPELQAFDQSCDGCLFGNPLGHYPDEYWLNINTDVTGVNPNTGQVETARQFLLDEMQARVKEAKLIGVDAIEFDDVDAWEGDTGLTIGPETQLEYNSSLANLAHRMGFSVGLKNDLEQASTLAPYFDFEINEECFAYHGCGPLKRWPAKFGKPVFNVEYGASQSSFCSKANTANFNSIGKTDDLYDLPYEPCR